MVNKSILFKTCSGCCARPLQEKAPGYCPLPPLKAAGVYYLYYLNQFILPFLIQVNYNAFQIRIGLESDSRKSESIKNS